MYHILTQSVPILYTKRARLTIIWNDFGRKIRHLSKENDTEILPMTIYCHSLIDTAVENTCDNLLTAMHYADTCLRPGFIYHIPLLYKTESRSTKTHST